MARKFGGDKLLKHIFQDLGVGLHHLGLSKEGIPKHPLYTPYDVVPQPLDLSRC
jgi:hypothetical protein